MRAALADRLHGLGLDTRKARPLSGGDISELWQIGDLVAKTGETVATEARMLQALAGAGAPVPAVHHAEPGLILLEHLAQAPPTPALWHGFGTALAALHARPAEDYGWTEDHAFGTVPLPNGPLASWPAFWAERRLLPFLPRLPAGQAGRLERLAADLGQRLPAAPGGLIHGDLWQGNLLFTTARAVMIDPAVIRGDGEVDLAMLTLFGQPPGVFGQGYGTLSPGWRERRPIYQLHPALVHLSLFGSSYAGLVDRLLDAAQT